MRGYSFILVFLCLLFVCNSIKHVSSYVSQPEPFIKHDFTSENSSNELITLYPSQAENDESLRFLMSDSHNILIGGKNKVLRLSETLTVQTFNICTNALQCQTYMEALYKPNITGGDFFIYCLRNFRCYRTFDNPLLNQTWSINGSNLISSIFYRPISVFNEVYNGSYFVQTRHWNEGVNLNFYKIDSSNNIIRIFSRESPRFLIKMLETSEKVIYFENYLDLTFLPVIYYYPRVRQYCKNEFYSKFEKPTFDPFYDLRSSLSSNFLCNITSMEKLSILTQVSDFFELNVNGSIKRLFYAAFNTMAEEVTSTGICLYDFQDVQNVFTPENFIYSENKSSAFNDAIVHGLHNCSSSRISDASAGTFWKRIDLMKNGIYPIQNRFASFVDTSGYKITFMLKLSFGEEDDEFQPKITSANSDFFSILYAGTDDGALLRIFHQFNRTFFSELTNHSSSIIVEKIQLFDKTIKIDDIKLQKDYNGRNKKLIIISKAQVRTVSVDFCKLRYESCQKCVETNKNFLFASSCYWQNNSCSSRNGLKEGTYVDSIDTCSFLAMSSTTSSTSSTTKTTSKFSSTTFETIFNSNKTTTLFNSTPIINISINYVKDSTNTSTYISITVILVILSLVVGTVIAFLCIRKLYTKTLYFYQYQSIDNPQKALMTLTKLKEYFRNDKNIRNKDADPKIIFKSLDCLLGSISTKPIIEKSTSSQELSVSNVYPSSIDTINTKLSYRQNDNLSDINAFSSIEIKPPSVKGDQTPIKLLSHPDKTTLHVSNERSNVAFLRPLSPALTNSTSSGIFTSQTDSSPGSCIDYKDTNEKQAAFWKIHSYDPDLFFDSVKISLKEYPKPISTETKEAKQSKSNMEIPLKMFHKYLDNTNLNSYV